MLKRDTCKNIIGGDKLIGSLALIRSNYLPEDFISTYIPFIATLLVKNQNESVDVNQIINDFKDCYGFIIPRTPMITILQKCATKNIIFRNGNGIFYVNKEIAEQFCFTEKAKAETEKYNSILEQFVEYVENKHSRKINIADAEKIFLAFLEDNSAKTIILDFGGFNSSAHANKQYFYMISSFITNASKNSHKLFNLIRDIAVAHLIASAITFDENDEAYAKSDICDLALYLDTPFILRVLGLNTNEMQTSYIDLMDEFKSCNYTFKIFGQTYDEIFNILQDCEKWIENPNYNAKYASLALRNFVKKKLKKSDITMYICNLSKKLEDLHITIDDENYYDEKYNFLQIDDSLIRNGIIETYKKSNFNFDEVAKQYTIEHDVKCISSIFKLRKNGVYRTYKDAKYLFLTCNSTLAYVTRNFTSEQNPSNKYNIYPCITDVVLGTNIWLKSPINRIEKFSHKKLLADCMASMTPSEELVNLLSESIESLRKRGGISEKDYYLLKSHAFDNNYLEKQTLNDEAMFSDKITEEILEDIKNEIISPYNEKIQKLDSEFKVVVTQNTQLSEELERINSQRENESKLTEEKHKSFERKAQKLLNNFIQFLLPVGIGLIALFILLITKLLPIQNEASTILILASGLLGFTSTVVTSSIKINLFTLQDKLIDRIVRYYIINDYKKNNLKTNNVYSHSSQNVQKPLDK